MTRPKTSRYPVSSFGPELLQVLIEGAQRPVEIPFPDQRTMKHFQMRIHMLRGAMQREAHPQFALATRARTSRSWNREKGKDAECVLTVRPNDSQFTDILDRAGIKTSPHTRDLLTETPAPLAPRDPTIQPDPESPHLDPYERFK